MSALEEMCKHAIFPHEGTGYDKDYFEYDDNGILRLKRNAPTGKIPQPADIVDYSMMFSHIASVDGVYDLSDWDMSEALSTVGMFFSCRVKSFGDLSKWNTSNIKDMSSMFSRSNIKDGVEGISNWDVSNVNSMSAMFDKFTTPTIGALDNWNVSNVQFMMSMFAECKIDYPLNLSKWDMSSVVRADNMFNGSDIKSVGDISNWLFKVTPQFNKMFYGCRIKDLGDLDEWFERYPNLRKEVIGLGTKPIKNNKP